MGRSKPQNRPACEQLESRTLFSASTLTSAAADPTPPREPGELHFFTDASLTTSGLVGNYIDSNLQGEPNQDDWRATQTVAGTRTDASLEFLSDNWGVRSQVGLTHGSDEVWQNFSVQWDGYVQIVSPHTGLTLGSDNGSRMWIDVNRDGQFDSSGPEYINNAWGFTPNFIKTQSTALLSPGVYPVRIQFAVDQLNAFELIAHSPPVVRVAYIVPSNRTPQPNAVPVLQQAVVWMHRFYQDQMERYGFGDRTFNFETQADGVTPQIWVLHVPDTDAQLRQNLFTNTLFAAFGAGAAVGAQGQNWLLIPETHVESSSGAITGSTSLGQSLGSGLGAGEAVNASDGLPFLTDAALTDDRPYAGMVIPAIGKFPLVQGVSQPNFNGSTVSSLSSVFHGALIHELTHGFGLPHDEINDDNFHGNLMFNGFRGFRGWAYPFRYSGDDMTLGYGEALALSESDYFNPFRAVDDSVLPSISTLSSGSIALANGLLPVHFTVTDRLGLSGVVLLKDGEMIGAMPLSGTGFDGNITTPYFSKGVSNTYGVVVYDQSGNRMERDVQITPKTDSDAAPQPFVRLSHSTVAINQSVLLDALRSTDPDDSISKVEWDLGNGSFTTPSSSRSLTTRFTEPGSYLIRARLTDAHGNQSISNPIALTVLSAGPSLVDFQVNGGSAQRSMVSSLTLHFDQPVALGSAALHLTRRDTGIGQPIAVANPSGDGQTFIVAFIGQSVSRGSLSDGIYDLTITPAGVTAQAPFAQPLAGSSRKFSFYRLLGDGNGDGAVDAADVSLFRRTFGKSTGQSGFLDFLDLDGDGRVDRADLRLLRGRLGLKLRVNVLMSRILNHR